MYHFKVDEQLTIRMLKINEAKKILSLINFSRSYLSHWIAWIDDILTIDDAEDYIRYCFEAYANREQLDAGIFYYDRLVGIVSFDEFDWDHQIGYISYLLNKSDQGKGIMTRAVTAMVEQAFAYFKLNKVEIRVATENERSQAIPERLNFKKEGVLRSIERLKGEYIDNIVYGLLRDEWFKQ